MTAPLGMMSSLPSFTGGSASSEARGGVAEGGSIRASTPFVVAGQGARANATASAVDPVSGIMNSPYAPLLIGAVAVVAVVMAVKR